MRPLVGTNLSKSSRIKFLKNDHIKIQKKFLLNLFFFYQTSIMRDILGNNNKHDSFLQSDGQNGAGTYWDTI